MVGKLGNFWWLGQLGQVWEKYGKSGEMYWGVGGSKGRCVGVWESMERCGGWRWVCGSVFGVWRNVFGMWEKVWKGCWGGGNVGVQGSVGRNEGQSGRAGKCGEKGGVTIWDPNFSDLNPTIPTPPDYNSPDP